MGLPREDWIQRHRLTVAEYHRMAEFGVIEPRSRVELIDGEVIDMAPNGTRHAWMVGELSTRLIEAFGRARAVRVRMPVTLGDFSEPEPDIVVVCGRHEDYRDRHPAPADVLVVIEVADTSLRLDREVKIPLYSRAGVPRVWLVDLVNSSITEFGDPGPTGFLSARVLGATGSIDSVEVSLEGLR